MVKRCPFEEEITNIIQMKTRPICFHCGKQYVKDKKHCGPFHNTWRPNCHCLSTSMIRIVTGNGFNMVEEQGEIYEQ